MEGWVDLGGWLNTEMAVTHRTTNPARRIVTLLIESNALPLSHAINPIASDLQKICTIHQVAASVSDSAFKNLLRSFF